MKTKKATSKKPATRLSQAERVLHFLSSGKTLTQKQARTKLKIASLSSRVNELRKAGIQVNSERVVVRNRDTGTKQSVVRYSI